MTPLALVPDADPRLAKLQALLRGPESDIERLGNSLMILSAWVMLTNYERSHTPGVDYIQAVVGKLNVVHQHLIDREKGIA